MAKPAQAAGRRSSPIEEAPQAQTSGPEAVSDVTEQELNFRFNALKARGKFGGGKTRQEFLRLEQEIKAKEEADRKTKSTSSIVDDTDKFRELNSTSEHYVTKSLSEICNQFVQALATGNDFTIAASEMPVTKIPEDVRQELAGYLADKIARVEAGLPLAARPSITSIAPSSDTQPLPDKAPQLYRDRPRDLTTGRLEFPDRFVARVYAPWIKDGELLLNRRQLKQLDPECEAAVAKWPTNHKGAPFPIVIPKAEPDEPPTADEVRQAQRIVQRAYRQRKAGQNQR